MHLVYTYVCTRMSVCAGFTYQNLYSYMISLQQPNIKCIAQIAKKIILRQELRLEYWLLVAGFNPFEEILIKLCQIWIISQGKKIPNMVQTIHGRMHGTGILTYIYHEFKPFIYRKIFESHASG